VTSRCPMFWYGDVLRNSQFSRRVYVAHISLFAILLPISSTILPHYFLFFLLSLSRSSTFLPPFHSTPPLFLLSVIPSAPDLSNPISSILYSKPPSKTQPTSRHRPIQLQYPPNPTQPHPNARKPPSEKQPSPSLSSLYQPRLHINPIYTNLPYPPITLQNPSRTPPTTRDVLFLLYSVKNFLLHPAGYIEEEFSLFMNPLRSCVLARRLGELGE